MQITEIKTGSGIEVLKGALVFINYDGRLEDGTSFDSSVAGVRTIFIPAELAYGERAIGEFIKPHSNLVFTVDLLEARLRV